MKTYFFVAFGNKKAWINVSRRNEREYISGLRSDIAEVQVSHLVFSSSQANCPRHIGPIEKGEFREFAKANGLELVGVRIGWSGWQGKVDGNDKAALVAAKDAFFKEFYKVHGDSLAIAKQHPDYIKYVK